MSTALQRPDLGIPHPQQASTNGSIHLHPGQIVVRTDPCIVTTILGSCVAVCLWDPTRRHGGMNHYLLPRGAENGLSSPRFGNAAMRTLIDRLLTLGSIKRDLQAKVFGGACILEAMRSAAHLGIKNAQIARKILEEEGIPVVGEDTGGTRARKVTFNLGDGTVWMKLL
jgi:chemotaxis protein CheD